MSCACCTRLATSNRPSPVENDVERLSRLGRDVDKAVVLLATHDSRYVTAAEIMVDGGLVAVTC